MLFKSLFTATVAAVASVVSAQDAAAFNPILTPSWGQVVNVPKPVDITWTPTSGGNVNLILRKGGSNELSTVATIASGISNTGSFKWTPSSDLSTDTSYSIQIVDASDSSKSNFSPHFTILSQGENWTSSQSGVSTTTVSTSASGSASASTSNSVSGSTTMAVMTSGSVSSASASASASASKASSSASASASKASSSASASASKASASASAAASASASAQSSAAHNNSASSVNKVVVFSLSIAASLFSLVL